VTDDLIGIVEAFYEPDQSDDEWLRLVVEKTRPLLDRQGLGIAGALYSCADPCSWLPSHILVCDVPAALQRVLLPAWVPLPARMRKRRSKHRRYEFEGRPLAVAADPIPSRTIALPRRSPT
jgi:hypothetical protein